METPSPGPAEQQLQHYIDCFPIMLAALERVASDSRAWTLGCRPDVFDAIDKAHRRKPINQPLYPEA